MPDFPSSSSASGIWTLDKHVKAKMGSNFPMMATPSVEYLVIAGGGGGGSQVPGSSTQVSNVGYGQGNAGGGNNGGYAGSGGGAGGPGAPQNDGGPGLAWLNGTTYCKGGHHDGGSAAPANSGNGGRHASGTGYAGGSGIFIIRYAGPQRGSGGTITSVDGYTYHTFTTSGVFTG